MTFVKYIKILITDKKRCTYRYLHKKTSIIKRPARWSIKLFIQ